MAQNGFIMSSFLVKSLKIFVNHFTSHYSGHFWSFEQPLPDWAIALIDSIYFVDCMHFHFLVNFVILAAF
jgi:hypothetical protein